MTDLYAVALGSNRRHARHGGPERVIGAAVRALAAAGMRIVAVSPVLRTVAMGPAGRGFANAVAIVATPLAPPAMLAAVKAIERDFGRRRGRRWGARVIDLDLVLWSRGRWPPAPRRAPPGRLAIPHAALETRGFVLTPLVAIARAWPAPRTIRRLHHRLTPPRPLPSERAPGR